MKILIADDDGKQAWKESLGSDPRVVITDGICPDCRKKAAR